MRALLAALLLAGCATSPQRPAWTLDRMGDAIDYCMTLGEVPEVIRAGDQAVVVCTESWRP